MFSLSLFEVFMNELWGFFDGCGFSVWKIVEDDYVEK